MSRPVISLLALAAALPLSAQTPSPQPAPTVDFTYQTDIATSAGVVMPGVSGGAIGFVAHEFSFSGGKPVTGAPYSAEQVTEHVETLADGNRIVNTTTTHLYRDSQGRTRTETTLPALQGGVAAPSLISILDPVAGITYLLNPQDKTATKLPAFGMHTAKIKAEQSIKGLPTVQTGGAAMPMLFQTHVSNGSEKQSVQKEDLGTQEVAGVQATGTRMTTTIPAGAIGNEQPIEVVSESWYSPDLKIVVKSVHNDPRMGQTTVTVNNLSRTEPDVSLFQVPADYTISDPKMPKIAIRSME